MLKDKFLADLEGNIYSLHPAFENYKLSDEEIQKICDNPSVEEEENEYTGKELFYDHSSIYLVPVEFIEKFKLSADKIMELYKEITQENSKSTSFLFHHISQLLKAKQREEADVQGYEVGFNNWRQFMNSNERIIYGMETIRSRQTSFTSTQKEPANQNFTQINDLYDPTEYENSSEEGEEKPLDSNFYKSLEGFSHTDINQQESKSKSVIGFSEDGFKITDPTNNKLNDNREIAIFCNPLGQEEKNIIPFPKIDTDGDGKVDTDTKNMSEESLKLLDKKVNTSLDLHIPRDKELVCIDVPSITYEKCGVNMKLKIAEEAKKAKFKLDDITIKNLKNKNFDNKKLELVNNLKNQEFSREKLVKLLQKENFKPEEIKLILDNAYTNKPLYNCTTVFPENDDSLTRRVPNWYQYFADKGLLYSGDKPYQVGDVIFLKDEQGIPNHSAIVTRINPKTGEPLQIVGASWTTETVKPYSWEEWKKVNHQNSFEHGGFRPPDYKE